MFSLPNPFNSLRELKGPSSSYGFYYSLPALEEQGIAVISKLPISLRIVLESVLRNCNGKGITEDDVKRLGQWNAHQPSNEEIPFVVSRIILQDFTGVPLLVDLAAMRDAIKKVGAPAELIEPLVPVDLVVDHSVQVDQFGTPDAFNVNLKYEFERNRERYELLKWGQQAFKTFKVVPPGVGIVHQVNLEYLAQVVFSKKIQETTILYPDTLVGTDSHTTMINGLGIVGWGVGGIEAESGMLGQPVYFQTPEVIGVHLSGRLESGVTATDLTLHITELLRKENVVDKFVEFFGEGAAHLSVADRATIANMAPEYGATMGYFPVDEKSLDYLLSTGRAPEHIDLVKEYLQAQGLFGIPKKSAGIHYTKTLELHLSDIKPCVSGPKRPQDRIDLENLKPKFLELLKTDILHGGYNKHGDTLTRSLSVHIPKTNTQETLKHGSVVIAAITSCTNTSNPSVMIGAGLLAKKAVKAGLKISPTIKTSLAPGSRVVTDYLTATGLQPYLDQLGFNLVGYGCTTCIGNSGPLENHIEEAIKTGDLVVASVLSGNRNFEARIHSSVKANFLMSPPLVVAFALAGRVDIDFDREPLGHNSAGEPVYLEDIWPSDNEIEAHIISGLKPAMFKDKYASVDNTTPEWNVLPIHTGMQYAWDERSTYIQNPPFLNDFSLKVESIEPIYQMRALAIFGDSVTTDHISPAGSISKDSPAGHYLLDHSVSIKDFNSYGSRRGNDRVMTRGTFANVRINNRLAGEKEGGFTRHIPSNEIISIYDACQRYKQTNTPLIVFAGLDYGMGSSRDWAAKGTKLLGVKVVVAQSFERIHRSNLLGMGVLPLEFLPGAAVDSLHLRGDEEFSLPDLNEDLKPRQEIYLKIKRSNGQEDSIPLKVRINTSIELDYFRNGGILPYVLRHILSKKNTEYHAC